MWKIQNLAKRKFHLEKKYGLKEMTSWKNHQENTKRFYVGNEVRLMNAYFVKCTSFEKDENGNVTVIHGTYDPETKSGSGFTGRKVKGTIHWVSCEKAVPVTVRLYENLVDEEKGVYNEDGSVNINPNSLEVLDTCYVEEAIKDYKQEMLSNLYVKDSSTLIVKIQRKTTLYSTALFR